MLTKPVDIGVISPAEYENELEQAMRTHMNMINTQSYFPKKEVEEILLRQQKYELWRMSYKNRFRTPEGLVKFTPSGASKSKRELFFRALRLKPDESTNAPFNNRWTRNSTAVHDAVQRDLLYAPTLIDEPLFDVQMIDKGEEFGLLPAWEKNIEQYKIIEHKGKKFVVSGMMDGLLMYNGTEGKQSVGFEFKTRTNDAWQVHNMKRPAPHHVHQCVAYSLVFETHEGEPLRDFLLTYEAVPKDKWQSGIHALNDIKSYHIKVTDRQRTNMLNRFADVVEAVENGEIPSPEPSRCFFCNYKSRCNGGC